MTILWCVTGGGQFLKESYESMKGLAEKNRVTLVFSRAGYEVMRMYGLLDEVRTNFSEVILEEEQGASAPMVGRLSKKEYKKVIVAPCTANTVAKIVYGVADSLVTNVVAQAGKCRIPVFILPTDAERIQETRIPLNIDYKKCIDCRPCPALENCPSNTFFISDRVRINLLKCNACKKCIGFCKYEAIEFGEEVSIGCREVDILNVEKIAVMEGLHVIKDISEI
jgi:dihydromethanopterin reductase (acceptor)